jgi:2-polyprenyl-6-methoxyphenol hydroxylase-like FAD-dependent oxidoreductase
VAIDFLIVGGGIGGAVLAHLLGRRGKRVLVLEKATAPAPPTRPEVLWPATVEVLRSLIPRELENRWMLPLQGGMVVYKRHPLVDFGPEVFRAAGVQMYSTAHTRELLLRQAPCEYRRGVEVTGVLREGGRIAGVRAREMNGGAEEDIRAGWTVGDDGVFSAVRRGWGQPLAIRRFPLNLLGFGFDWPASLPPATARFWLNEHRRQSGLLGMGALPLPEGQGVALVPAWPEVFEDVRRLQIALRLLTEQDPVLTEVMGGRTYPGGLTRFRLAWGRTPCFGVPGALLMGDAAHPVTPAGGQGANLSVADALVIADVALSNAADLLTEYERRRRPAALRSLALSRGAARVFSLPRLVFDLGSAMLPWAARWMNRHPERFGRFLRTAASAFQETPPVASR